MPRLDVFVCDRCDTRVINGECAATMDWVQATFPYVLSRLGGPPKDMLLCPRCVRDIHEPLPKLMTPHETR